VVERAPGRLGPDTLIVASIGTLVAIGLIMIFSASSVIASLDHHDAGYFFKRQVVWLASRPCSPTAPTASTTTNSAASRPYALAVNIVALSSS
jgi:hypothetical protein